ncbi:hypothetical protein JRO89_XS13G0263000 [Xanthoceras sorbifolium]|uniref:RNase H type-1 domain-containing protein n=1 Tax=Xanthoceras sorbifolium TaxID=99658 RepID=A0ABQ8H9Z9_9ROSI|nr:hypothetical protein JRO89_XS13G0263000 [Xanthoceras sorbifolium]
MRSGFIRVGVIIRDCFGLHLADVAKSLSGFFDVEFTKAKTILFGFQMAIDLSLAHSSFLIESNALIIVNICYGSSSSLSKVDNIVHDIRLSFVCFLNSVSFIFRVCNNVAHVLAKVAVRDLLDSVWVQSDWLLSLVKSDCSTNGLDFESKLNTSNASGLFYAIAVHIFFHSPNQAEEEGSGGWDQILKRENDPRQINHLHQIKQPTIKLVIPVGLNDASGSTSEWCSPIRVSELQ